MLLDSVQDETALPSELNMYSKDVDSRRLVLLFQMLPDLVRTYNDLNPTTAIAKSTNLRSLCEIITSSKTMFSEVYTLLHLVLTIPVTTSTAERTFSTLRQLKTFL